MGILEYAKKSVREQVEARTVGFLGLLPFHIGMFLSIQVPGLSIVWGLVVKFVGPLLSTGLCTVGVCVIKTYYTERLEIYVKGYINRKKKEIDEQDRAA